ncbi:unnamed protein product [Urochloa decumbens]|uniref:CASP-like protein n=1 Tax=Urochloa decumbens TaxID=240449 RepID=A0ABC9AYV0_9POAL
MAGDKKSDGSTDAACLALRIATVALSVASAAMMASASQRSCTAAGCSPSPASQQQVSYSDYSSLKYSLAATIVSAAVQAAAAFLKACGGKDGESKSKVIKSVYELVDAASQVFLYSSSALSFSVDDFGTCGHRVAGVCKGSGEFCQRVRASGILSMAAAVCLAASKYLKDVPVSTWFKSGEKKAKKGCGPRGHCHH